MTPAIIERFCYAEDGTFGVMSVGDITIYTVERPWLNNQPGISCIPCGDYNCAPRHYHRGNYAAIELKEVPCRTHILIHKGNLPKHVQGCVAVGSYTGCLSGQWAVLNSAGAFNQLMDIVGGKNFKLVIKNKVGGLLP